MLPAVLANTTAVYSKYLWRLAPCLMFGLGWSLDCVRPAASVHEIEWVYQAWNSAATSCWYSLSDAHYQVDIISIYRIRLELSQVPAPIRRTQRNAELQLRWRERLSVSNKVRDWAIKCQIHRWFECGGMPPYSIENIRSISREEWTWNEQN